MNAKVKAIVSHLFLIGWIISLLVNMNEKEEFASFYIRQVLGIMITGFAFSLLNVFPLIGNMISALAGIVLFVFWIMSLIWAINGEMKTIPWIGEYFQDWFRSL